jgi:hypothetical protein
VQQRLSAGAKLVTTVTLAGLVAVTGCSSSSKGKTTAASSSSSSGGSAPASSSPSGAASSSGGGSSGGSALTVTGDFSAAGTQQPGCGQLQDQGGGNFRIPLDYTPTTSGGGITSGSTYSLIFLQIPAGKTQLNGTVSNPQTTIKFTYPVAANDSLNWGVNAAPPNANGSAAPGSASGSLDISSDGKQGTVNLTLGFAGDDQGTVKSGDHKDIQIMATWKCP